MLKYLAIAALLTGCSAPTNLSFAFEGAPEDYETAVEAADQWNQCGIVGLRVSNGRDDSGQIAIQYAVDIVGEPGNVGGVYRYGPGLIEYTHKGSVSNILTHEMGHALGLGHYGTGVMSPDAESNIVTPDDCNHLANR